MKYEGTEKGRTN